jgi:hypothetical protein
MAGMSGPVDDLLKVLPSATKTTTEIIGATKGGGGSAASAAKQPSGPGFLSSLSNTDLAIGGIGVIALILAIAK